MVHIRLLGTRAKDGSLVVDPVKFPGGMKAIGDYLHARQLKLGKLYWRCFDLHRASKAEQFDHRHNTTTRLAGIV